MSRWYRFLYGIGFRPWESDTAELGAQIARLGAAEEQGREPPYGSALDLGCGTGRWSVMLAKRGWIVTGIDVVPKAIRSARRRAREADVDLTFVEGDITSLRGSGVGSGFSLILDVECFNHLTDRQRAAAAQEIDAVAATNSTILMLVWTPARRGPLPQGASRSDLAAAFPGWEITHEEDYEGEMPGPLKSAAPRWYRLTRTDGPRGAHT